MVFLYLLAKEDCNQEPETWAKTLKNYEIWKLVSTVFYSIMTRELKIEKKNLRSIPCSSSTPKLYR